MIPLHPGDYAVTPEWLVQQRLAAIPFPATPVKTLLAPISHSELMRDYHKAKRENPDAVARRAAVGLFTPRRSRSSP